VLRLTLLAPDLVESVPDGRQPRGVTLGTDGAVPGGVAGPAIRDRCGWMVACHPGSRGGLGVQPSPGEEAAMEIGAFPTFVSPRATPRMTRGFGRRAEDIGLDSIWPGEHVVLSDRNTSGHPGSKDGRTPVPEGGGMLDVTATFGLLAAATSRLGLGTGVALVPQRNPPYTAKEIRTLDWLAEGRIAFGVGWNKEEVEACGYRREDRGAPRRVPRGMEPGPERVRQRLAELETLVKMAT
jgi:Luciferase-like monooxygenase